MFLRALRVLVVQIVVSLVTNTQGEHYPHFSKNSVVAFQPTLSLLSISTLYSLSLSLQVLLILSSYAIISCTLNK